MLLRLSLEASPLRVLCLRNRKGVSWSEAGCGCSEGIQRGSRRKARDTSCTRKGWERREGEERRGKGRGRERSREGMRREERCAEGDPSGEKVTVCTWVPSSMPSRSICREKLLVLARIPSLLGFSCLEGGGGIERARAPTQPAMATCPPTSTSCTCCMVKLNTRRAKFLWK